MTAETFENSSFGPVSESGIADGLSGIHSHFKSRNYDKKKTYRLDTWGFKQKWKKVSQDYRKAINERQRSGSGKLVCKNWNL